MARNRSYIFFREHPELGRRGRAARHRGRAADRRPLARGRSPLLAARRAGLARHHARPGPRARRPLRRLMVAQDTGGAIKGVVRGDVFWGAGERAEAIAGRDAQPGPLRAAPAQGAGPDQLSAAPRRTIAGVRHLPRRSRSAKVAPAPSPMSGRHVLRSAAARRPVRHLPGRPVPADGRLRRGQAAGGRRLPGRGAARPDLLRPAGLQPGRSRRHRSGSRGARIAAFAGYDYVVAPSGSCAGMLKKHYPELFDARLGRCASGRASSRRAPSS